MNHAFGQQTFVQSVFSDASVNKNNAVLWSYQLSDEERVIVKKEMKKYELGHIMTEMRSRWCRGHPTSIQSWV